MNTTLYAMTLNELDELADESEREAVHWWGVVDKTPTPASLVKAMAFGRLAGEASTTAHNRRYKDGQPCRLECFCRTKQRRAALKAAKKIEGNQK